MGQPEDVAASEVDEVPSANLHLPARISTRSSSHTSRPVKKEDKISKIKSLSDLSFFSRNVNPN